MQQLPQRESPVHSPAAALALVGDAELPADLAVHLISTRYGLPAHLADLVVRLAGLGGTRP
jgi:hypothetical protein